MPKFYILAGMPGSGKSTTAKDLFREGVIIVSTDAIRLALNSDQYPRGERYILLDPTVWKITEQVIRDLLQQKIDIAIDATNLNRESRSKWKELVLKYGGPTYKTIIIWHNGKFDSPERWSNERSVPLDEYNRIINSLRLKLEVPVDSECDELIFK